MDSEFPEQFKCPVCFEIPEKEIYQCKNGHNMCDNCVTGLSLCPQCRVNLKPKNIRNRALEDLLDMLKFNCSFKLEGCSTKLTRKEISAHHITCEFGGDRVPLCRYLGYACQYKLKTRNIQESIQHLQQEHSILLKTSNTLEMKLANIKNIDRKINCVWKPVLLNFYSNHYLVVVYINSGNVSFTCIQFGEDCSKHVDAKFVMVSKPSKKQSFNWTMEPIPLTEVERSLKFPPVLVSFENLLSFYVEADVLKLQLFLSDNIITQVYYPNISAELDSYQILPSTQLDQSEVMTFEAFAVALYVQFDKPIGDNHQCNACRMKPIIGPRYQCLQCREYDLCSMCIIKNEHSFHHFALICTNDQVSAMNSVVARSTPCKPFFECDNKKNLAPGYAYGSISSDANDLRCQMCENPPDFICLQCKQLCGVCRFCFLLELSRHDKNHFFFMTMSESARQFALHLLRKHNVLTCLKYEKLPTN